MRRGMRTQQVQGHEGEFRQAGLKHTWKGWFGVGWRGHCNWGQIWKGLECLVSSLDFIAQAVGEMSEVYTQDCGILTMFKEDPSGGCVEEGLEVCEIILGDQG